MSEQENVMGVSVDTVRSDESEVNVFYAGAKSRPTGLIGEASFETGVMNMEKHSNGEKFNAKALSVGAQGGITSSNIGGEVKASVVEATKTSGNISATLGLNANTGAAIGLDRTGAKVLGTGGYIGRDGVELSLFGSGFKIKF